jgi:high-affinity nickel-transport protein
MNTASITHGAGESTRGKVVSMYATLALINLLAWTWAWLVLRSSPALLGTAILLQSTMSHVS